jgi:cell division protein FtsZ
VQNVPKAEPMIKPVSTPPAPRDAESSSRRTINSLIHRMTGQLSREETPLRTRASEPAPRATDDFEDTERERVDIPAFLRRQAN